MVTATAPALARREFRAMGTEITLAAARRTGVGRALVRAGRWIAAFEGRFSRFLPTSELSLLNASAGRPVRVSPLMFDFVRLCLDLSERSGGVFDPTLLRELEALGYDRTFDDLIANYRPASPRTTRSSTSEDVRLDPTVRTVTLPAGIGIDSGGLGKGFAADRVAALLGDACLVDCGGDIRLRGRPPGRPAWCIAVEDPFMPSQDLATLAVEDCGVATSSVLKRRWLSAGGLVHHLLDSRSGLPSGTDLAAVTVIAPTATMADFHGKVALLKGAREGRAYLEAESATEGLLVTMEREVIQTSGLARHLWGRP
jgi:thiamine biosynthesis lipoprotein